MLILDEANLREALLSSLSKAVHSITMNQLRLTTATAAALLALSAAVCPPAGFDTQGALDGGFDINW
jgi:hypothetical protein